MQGGLLINSEIGLKMKINRIIPHVDRSATSTESDTFSSKDGGKVMDAMSFFSLFPNRESSDAQTGRDGAVKIKSHSSKMK